MIRIAYSTATVIASVDCGLVLATVEGVITFPLATEIIAGSECWAPQRFAQVVSCEMACVRLSAADLFEAASRARQDRTPTALVVAEEQLATFAEYAKMHTDRGILKAVFTNAEEARRWATKQAHVAEYWSRIGRAQQACP